METKEIKGIYEELRGILLAIQVDENWFDDNGFADHVNKVIERIPKICSEIDNVDSYLIRKEYSSARGNIINVIPAKTKINSIIGRIKGTYKLGAEIKNKGNTFIQNQSQIQSQSLTAILDLQEKIISELPKHKKGTKERSFLEKLKLALPTVKNMTDILDTVLRLGAEMSLNSSAIYKLLGM